MRFEMKKTIKIIEPWSGKKHDVNIITLLFYVVITTILIIYFRLSWERGYFISFGGLYFGDDYPFVMIILFIVGILITTIGLKLQIKKKPINKFVLKNRTIMKILWIMQILLFGFFI